MLDGGTRTWESYSLLVVVFVAPPPLSAAAAVALSAAASASVSAAFSLSTASPFSVLTPAALPVTAATALLPVKHMQPITTQLDYSSYSYITTEDLCGGVHNTQYMTDDTTPPARQANRPVQAWLPLGALILSVGTWGLGVVLSGLIENSMRRKHSGVGEEGRGVKREYKQQFNQSHSNRLFVGCGGSEGSLGQSVSA